MNVQMSKLEATLEGYFSAKNKPVRIMQPNSKHVHHGLQLPPQIAAILENKRTVAISRNNGKPLSKNQHRLLNKQKAVKVATHFLEEHLQEAHVQQAFETSSKKDDMADALLQAWHMPIIFWVSTTTQQHLLLLRHMKRRCNQELLK